MSSHAVIPLFKGDVPPVSGSDAETRRRDNEAVITGINPDTDERIECAAYLDVLKRVAASQRQIAENVARVFGAALFTFAIHKGSPSSRLFLLEGCQWDWGTSAPRMGSEISNAMYQVVPETMRQKMHEPVVASETRRTRDEFYSLMAHAQNDFEKLVAVTHPYHAFRSGLIGGLAASELNRKWPEITTPGAIATGWNKFYADHDASDPDAQFMIDAIRIGEPTLATNMRELPKEAGPLLGLHLVERISGFDLEGEILKKMAVRNAGKK